MENEELSGNKNELVSADDAVEFFEKRAINPCPTCGFNKWHVVSPLIEEGDQVLSLPGIAKSTGKSIGKAMPLIAAVCNKCAYVRVHAHYSVLEWVNAGKPEFTDDEA